MGIDGNDVIDSEGLQFLQGNGTVQGFPGLSGILTACIKERHYYIDSGSISTNGGYNPFYALEVLIRTHPVFISEHIVGAAVVSHISQNVNVLSSDGFLKNNLAFSVGKADIAYVYYISFLFSPPFEHKIFIHKSSESIASAQQYKTQISYT